MLNIIEEPMPINYIFSDVDFNKKEKRKRNTIPLCEKVLLTIDEAAEYTGIGMQKLRDISNDERCEFVLWNGSKRMFKRKKLESYLDYNYSI